MNGAYTGPPITLGNAAAARVRFIVRCLDRHHQIKSDPAEMAERYGVQQPPCRIGELVCRHCLEGTDSACAPATASYTKIRTLPTQVSMFAEAGW